jgi:hypothetical protein
LSKFDFEKRKKKSIPKGKSCTAANDLINQGLTRSGQLAVAVGSGQ